MTRKTIRRIETGHGAVLMVTHAPDGQLFGSPDGRAVSHARAREVQGDLFVKPSEDGLFKGMSQTWVRQG